MNSVLEFITSTDLTLAAMQAATLEDVARKQAAIIKAQRAELKSLREEVSLKDARLTRAMKVLN